MPINNVLKPILSKMCEMVGVESNQVDFKAEQWFWEHTWTQKQEDEFIEWLTQYLVDNIEARRLAMRFPTKRRKQCKESAEAFVWNYGWKTAEE